MMALQEDAEGIKWELGFTLLSLGTWDLVIKYGHWEWDLEKNYYLGWEVGFEQNLLASCHTFAFDLKCQ